MDLDEDNVFLLKEQARISHTCADDKRYEAGLILALRVKCHGHH